MTVKRANTIPATFGGLLAIVLWSATFALARSLSENLGPLTTGAAVYLFGGGLLLVEVFCRSRGSLRRLFHLPSKYLWGCGGLFVAYTALLYLAVGLCKDRQQLLEIALVNYLWPALTVVLSIPLLKQQAGSLIAPGTFLALAGVWLVMTLGADVSWASFKDHLAENPTPYLLALVAAVAWALYSNLARCWSGSGSAGAVALFIPITGGVLLGVRCLVPETSVWSLRTVVEVGALGIITAAAYVLWDVAMRRGNHLFVVVCSYFTPLLSTLVSCAYLKVVPGSRIWAGCVLLVVGSLLSWRSVSSARLGRSRSFE